MVFIQWQETELNSHFWWSLMITMWCHRRPPGSSLLSFRCSAVDSRTGIFASARGQGQCLKTKNLFVAGMLANLQWDTTNTHAGWGLIYLSNVSEGHRWTGKYLWFKNVFWLCRRKNSWICTFFISFSFLNSHLYVKWRAIFYPYKVYNGIYVC